MKLKLLFRVVAFLFFLSLVGLNAQITINGGGNYATIQAAIDAASANDVIYVPAGTYTEDLAIPATLTDLEIYGDGATSIIQGVNNGGGPWPTAFVNINILADGVIFHDFTVKNPAWEDGHYSSGMIVGAPNVEIYNVTFVGPSSDDLDDISQCFQTYSNGAIPGVDISGLYLHDCTFTTEATDTYGYEAIYINPDDGAGIVTIENNILTGLLFRGITTERENVVIADNSLSNTQTAGHAAHTGLNLDAKNITITGNTISDFNYGIDLGSAAFDLSDIEITGNTLGSSNAVGIRIRGVVGTDLFVNNNTISGNATSGMDAAGVTGTVNAEFNWWGDATGPDGEGPGTGDAVTANVDYSPWLGDVVGTDPMPLGTDDNIQDAIDAAVPGATIIVGAGSYPAISITTDGITLIGTGLVDIDHGSAAISINADNVTIDGFTFSFDAVDYAIEVTGDHTDLVVKNCIFNNVNGASVGNGIDNNAGAGTHYLDATENNNWGDITGPTHASNTGGLGVVISDYVIYEWVELSEPVNSVTGISIFPTFEWTPLGAGPAPVYHLTVSANSDLSNPLYDEDMGALTTLTTTELLDNFPLSNNTKYYWAVTVSDGTTDLYTTATSYFTTVANITINLSAPSNNMQLYLFDPAQFTWWLGQAQGTLKFYLQILEGTPTATEWAQAFEDEVTTPGTNNHFYENISNIYTSVNGLSGGTVYSWRVIAYYDDGATASEFDWADRVVKYSSIFKFTTQGGAVKAYPSWPVGGNTIYNLLPTYYWYTMQYDAAANFTVYVVENGDNLGDLTKLDDDVLVATLPAGTNTYVQSLADLEASTTYLWQVKTTNGTATNYSAIATFKTYDAPGVVPTKPTLSYPTGGMDIYTTTPTLYWYINGYNTGTLTFTVELSIDGGTTWFNATPATTQDTYLQISGLTPGKTYKWRVTSSDGGAHPSVTSDPASFVVVGGGSSSTVLNWPTGNALLYSNTPTLSWGVDGSTLGWTGYIVKWYKGTTEPNWKTGVVTGSATSVTITDIYETFYSMTTGLEYGAKYYWAVALYDGSTDPEDFDYSSSSFTIAGGNAQVILSLPANNANNVSKTPTFYWYTNGTGIGVNSYQVVYSKNELFNANVVTLGPVTTTSATVVTDLEPGTTYWWYVELSYDTAPAVYSQASPIYKFTVDPGASAVMPLVGSPANGVKIGTNSPYLSWYLPAQSSSALSYEVELSSDAEFNEVTTYQNISDLNAQVSSLDDGEYFWRVRSMTENSTSSYSNVGNFKLGSGVTGVDEEDLPLTFNLDQNFPNPFNPTTTINYSLPEASFVTIKIYNMLGQEIKTLVSDMVKAGRFSVEWRGDNNYGQNVSSGTYIYRISAGDFVQAKKMILLK